MYAVGRGFAEPVLGLSWVVGAGEDRGVGAVACELFEGDEVHGDCREVLGREVGVPERGEGLDAALGGGGVLGGEDDEDPWEGAVA
jgi:hypothetical protein